MGDGSMSTLKVTNYQDINGNEKIFMSAFVNFDGDPVTINGDKNVSSITDSGTGNFKINFDTNMSSTAYGAAAISASQWAVCTQYYLDTKTTSQYPLRILLYTFSSYTDGHDNHVLFGQG
jgi:hypothetical protein